MLENMWPAGRLRRLKKERRFADRLRSYKAMSSLKQKLGGTAFEFLGRG